MISRYLAAVVAGVGAATVLAAPAVAQTGVDQAFLQAVRDKGVPINDDAQALDLAHSTCGVLSGGGSAADALQKIASATNWSSDQATNFGIAAVVAYCKDMMSVATAPQQQAQLPDASDLGPTQNVPRYNVKNAPEPRQYNPYGPPRPPRHPTAGDIVDTP